MPIADVSNFVASSDWLNFSLWRTFLIVRAHSGRAAQILSRNGVTHHMQPLYLNPQRVGVVGVNSAQIAEDLIATPS
jgi:hypothetical protein